MVTHRERGPLATFATLVEAARGLEGLLWCEPTLRDEVSIEVFDLDGAEHAEL